ncbi:unnamed protein product [Dicrocoelium dendriticum]|nr:unnamed protein product [Dicrocoelium dendriticum]
MPSDKDEIHKMFYTVNERVGSIMEVSPNQQKKGKHKYLVVTVTITKPHVIQIYAVKNLDGEFRKTLICNIKSLKKLDCRDTKTQPTYDVQLITELKTWNFRATKLEAKGEFVSAFCRITASLQPQWFKAIQLANMPANVTISNLSSDQSLESLLNPSASEYRGDDTEGLVQRLFGARTVADVYRPLTEKEENDIGQFLDELATDSSQLNAAQLTEMLQKELTDVEGTNIHSIMASETQVLKLMTTLDQAIEKADKLEQQMESYHQHLSDVEEAMAALRDSDQLVQTTVDNRDRLLKVLENLLSRLTLDAKYVHSLLEVKLDTPSDIIKCCEAATYLDTLINAKSEPGEEHLRAVDEKTRELLRIRDSFATELAKKVNNTVVGFSRQLRFVTGVNFGSAADLDGLGQSGGSRNSNRNSSIRAAPELYMAQRDELVQLSLLIGGWMKKNRKDIYTELKQEYIRQMQPFFHHQVSDFLTRAQHNIFTLLRPSKSGNVLRAPEVATSEVGSTLSVHNPEASVLGQISNIVDDTLLQIRSLLSTEERFLIRFFDLRGSDDVQYVHQTADDMETLNGCMWNLLRDIETDALNFTSACEQIQPTVIMPILVVISRHAEAEARRGGQLGTTVDGEYENSSFVVFTLSRFTMIAKRSFNRYIEKLIQSFNDSKPSKKSRCGVLQIVRSYADFAERSIAVFSQSSRLVDLERAHGELVRALMAQLEQIASQTVKTPREVVQLGMGFCLNLMFTEAFVLRAVSDCHFFVPPCLWFSSLLFSSPANCFCFD